MPNVYHVDTMKERKDEAGQTVYFREPVKLAMDVEYLIYPAPWAGDESNAVHDYESGPVYVAPELSSPNVQAGLDGLTASNRKRRPIATGVVDYFPDALAEVALVSYTGNEQHHKGAPLHWDKTKSMDESDALMRHFLQRGTYDTDGMRHSAKVAWRALALLQREIENETQEG